MMRFSSEIAEARRCAGNGQFDQLVLVCESVRQKASTRDHDTFNQLGVILLQAGLLDRAASLFEHILGDQPDHLAGQVHLAQILHERGEHRTAKDLYDLLLSRHPDQPIIRRNALVTQEYDPSTTAQERLERALEWGRWISSGVRQDPPPIISAAGRPLRIGYVSADFCQHTVGFLVKDVLTSHDPESELAICYSTGGHEDWITHEIKAATQFRAVHGLDDQALARQVRRDKVDVLVDLSGHTAGSRLSVFAHQPAPVQVSWLGYFATTGLSAIDAVLLDRWHRTSAIDAQFSEQLIDLPSRLHFSPPPFSPKLSGPPALHRGFITFGSFNNTAKLNEDVFSLWADILIDCPGSRLVLKWRTLLDEVLREKITRFFSRRGISPERLDLRGPSYHEGVLKEYADIDIALDPFPFCGGMTTCEALWMGVPVITLPGERAVSRQSMAVLNLIGYPNWVATSPRDYREIALRFSADPESLRDIRVNLRSAMTRSRLMQTDSYTRDLGKALRSLHGEKQKRLALG